ncbi:transporter substrate-binding domain-containing protein [Streptococcus sp. zg-JUN1979]|uniref:transporter substrate-binding domain-containing protein n=1 Tax=Streptococcus sp. zg-JUN1979 TaxID=3391450 RepID=UPI0039A5C70F
MKRWRQLAFLLGLVAVLGTSLAASADSKKTVVVATDLDTAPFTYKKGKSFKGYDIDVVKAIFKGSDYKVTFKTVAFDSITVGIDAGKYDIGANDYGYNDERAKRYLFSEPLSKSNFAVVSAKGKSYSSLDELSGKTTAAMSGTNYVQVLENWNKEHPDKKPITINYVDGTSGVVSRLKDIETGKIDFILYDAISASYIVKDQGMDLTVTNLKDDLGGQTEGLEYLLFAKTEKGEELKAFADKRIKALKEDGTLKKLSQKYFGGDYVSGIDN